ncbi:C2H2-type zinc finger transcription factor [Mucor lusitanicus CBS 277.49]|uniref:C2H2-type zinc finger transcription factor n=1 Tax=Mucor lusitanicus CBS 277.49 TaxID=747725 RepID=A0A168IXS6_MUCCL|nr:C2H2-type zinc finger transcription factor [Mucor lusitanicus CBS 277.49]
MTNAQKRKVVTSGNKENRAKFACSGCDKAFESSASRRTHEYDKHTNAAFCTMETAHPKVPQLQPLHDKSNVEDFSFEGGSRLVLNEQNDNAGEMVKFLRLAPAMLVAKKEKITTYLPMFINQEAAPLVSDLSFTGTIISHSSKSNNNESLIQNAGLNFGYYAKIDESIGPFIEHGASNDEPFLRIENTIESISRVPPLFTGAIIADSTFTYIITSCEVYGRDATIDDHLENQGDSFPHAFDPVSRRYEDMKILVDKQSDGGGIINKLIIGTAHFNLLITGGFLLHPVSANAAAAGPTTHPYLINRDLNHASLYYREEHLDRFQAMTMPS